MSMKIYSLLLFSSHLTCNIHFLLNNINNFFSSPLYNLSGRCWFSHTHKSSFSFDIKHHATFLCGTFIFCKKMKSWNLKKVNKRVKIKDDVGEALLFDYVWRCSRERFLLWQNDYLQRQRIGNMFASKRDFHNFNAGIQRDGLAILR